MVFIILIKKLPLLSEMGGGIFTVRKRILVNTGTLSHVPVDLLPWRYLGKCGETRFVLMQRLS